MVSGRRQLSCYLLRWTPGGSVGAGGARICGENKLPPVGLMPFSVGDGGAALDGGGVVVVVVVVVVVDVVEGACSPPLPHPDVSKPIVTRTPPPATAIKRRVDEFELMIQILSAELLVVCCKGSSILGCPTHNSDASHSLRKLRPDIPR